MSVLVTEMDKSKLNFETEFDELIDNIINNLQPKDAKEVFRYIRETLDELESE